MNYCQNSEKNYNRRTPIKPARASEKIIPWRRVSFFVWRPQSRSSVLISDGAARTRFWSLEWEAEIPLNTYSDSVGTAGVLTY